MLSVVLREDHWLYLVHKALAAGYEHSAKLPELKANQFPERLAIVEWDALTIDRTVGFLVPIDKSRDQGGELTYFTGVSDPQSHIKWKTLLAKSKLFEPRMELREQNAGMVVGELTGIKEVVLGNTGDGDVLFTAIHPDIPIGKHSCKNVARQMRSVSLRMLRQDPGEDLLEKRKRIQDLRMEALSGPKLRCRYFSTLSDAAQGNLSWESPVA